MLRRLASGAALVVTAAMVLAGCAPPEPTETTPPPASAMPTTASPSNEEVLRDRALAVSSELLGLVEQGFRDGVLPDDELRRIATDELIAMIQVDLSEFQAQRLQVTGTSRLESPSIVSNDATGALEGSLVLSTCWDTSGTTTTDQDGAVVSGGVTRQPRLFEVEYTATDMIVTRTGPPTSPMAIPGCE